MATPESKYAEVRASLGRFPEVDGLGVMGRASDEASAGR
jgi:hypothetical protein